MSVGCECNAGLSNTGRPGCVPIQSVTSSLIVVPLVANDGTKNGIDLSATLPTWSTLINEADASKRWFPLPAFENVELPKADTQFEEAASGRQAYLRQGKRSFTGELWADDSTPTFLGKLQASRCVDFGIYIVDVNGNLIGSQDGDYLYPVPVDNASWDPKWMPATDSTVQKIMLGFDWDRLFDESTLYMLTPDEAGVNFNDLTGLIDVNFIGAVGSLTFDSVLFSAALDYGTALNKIVYTGATNVSDWDVYNVTTASSLNPIAGVTEGPDGDYTLSFAAQSTGDVIRVTVARDGYIGTTDITLP